MCLVASLTILWDQFNVDLRLSFLKVTTRSSDSWCTMSRERQILPNCDQVILSLYQVSVSVLSEANIL